MDENQETAQTWNKLAERYEEHFMDLTLYNDSYDLLIENLPAGAAEVLEVGCGPGNISRYLLQQRPALRLHGIDYAPAMVELAQKNNPTATFEVRDCRQIGSLGRSFDAVVCGFCFPYLSPEEAAPFLADCAALLRPDGLLYLSFVEGDPDKSGWLTGSTGDRVYFYYYTLEDLQSLFAQVGFADFIEQIVSYPRAGAEPELHSILIARKTGK